MALVQQVQPRGELRRALAPEDDLHFDRVLLQLGKAALEQDLSLIHDADVVAHILQLTQVVAGDEHRRAALGDVLHDKAPHLTAHHGVEAVHRLIQNEIVRHTAHGDPERRLLLHSLGKTADELLFVQRKDAAQLLVALHVELRIEAAVKFHHVADARLHKIVPVVGDGGDALLDRHVLPYVCAVHRDGAGVLPVYAGQVAQQRGFARAVRPHETVDRALRHGQARAVERGKAVKGLHQLTNFDHFSSSSR